MTRRHTIPHVFAHLTCSVRFSKFFMLTRSLKNDFMHSQGWSNDRSMRKRGISRPLTSPLMVSYPPPFSIRRGTGTSGGPGGPPGHWLGHQQPRGAGRRPGPPHCPRRPIQGAYPLLLPLPPTSVNLPGPCVAPASCPQLAVSYHSTLTGRSRLSSESTLRPAWWDDLNNLARAPFRLPSRRRSSTHSCSWTCRSRPPSTLRH